MRARVLFRAPMTAAIHAERVPKRYGGAVALDDVTAQACSLQAGLTCALIRCGYRL